MLWTFGTKVHLSSIIVSCTNISMSIEPIFNFEEDTSLIALFTFYLQYHGHIEPNSLEGPSIEPFNCTNNMNWIVDIGKRMSINVFIQLEELIMTISILAPTRSFLPLLHISLQQQWLLSCKWDVPTINLISIPLMR